MRQQFITRNNSDSLAILFLGWSFSPKPFLGEKTNCDLLVVYDYNNFHIDISDIKQYDNIYIFAWSFGVYGASRFILQYPTLPICFKMAINGTLIPIDDSFGIPISIFTATLNNLSERSLLKFYRRICSNSISYEALLLKYPDRDINNLRSELESIENESAHFKVENILWDKVLVGKNDKIFPLRNQLQAWKGVNNLIVTDDAHYPDNFIDIINNNIINKSLLKKRFSKSSNNYNENASIQRQIAENLIHLWKKIGFTPNSFILEIGCGTGFLTNKYIEAIKPQYLLLNDLCPINDNFIEGTQIYKKVIGDAEKIDFSRYGEFNYIVSASTIQWFENIQSFLKKCASWLSKNGLIVFSTFGKENMKEINSITSITLNYYDINQLKEFLEAQFDVLIIEEQKIITNFDSPIDVLRHIKATGVNALTQRRWSKSDLNDFILNYNPTDNKYILTYNPIYIIARKK